MWGGLNKVMRNIVAGTQDSEFEKVRETTYEYMLGVETDESIVSLG